MIRSHRVGAAATKNYSVSVVIPTVGKSAHLRGLLERLQLQITDFEFEVLVVANIPQQALRQLVNSMGTHGNGSFEYHETGRLGVNLARNKGLERAHGKVVLFLDDDAILASDGFLAAHENLHRKFEDAVAIGGPYRLTPNASVWDRAYHEIAHDWLRRHTMSRQRTTQLLGGNFSVKKDELKKNCWSFDEEITFGGAETGLCLRIANANRNMYFFEDLVIGHAPDLSRSTLRRKAFLQGAGARWRTSTLPATLVRYTNEQFPALDTSDRDIQRARALYNACFDFGWSRSPYGSKLLRGPPAFPVLSYCSFLLFRRRPLRLVRRWHRELYAAVRTAWVNGARARRPSIR